MSKLCNLCGLPCAIGSGFVDVPDFDAGLLDASVCGQYGSTPGNGDGALDDTIEYRFSMCEWCLDWLFDQFKVPVAMRDYMIRGSISEGIIDENITEPFRPAAKRVAEDNWRSEKSAFFAEYERRNVARSERTRRGS